MGAKLPFLMHLKFESMLLLVLLDSVGFVPSFAEYDG